MDDTINGVRVTATQRSKHSHSFTGISALEMLFNQFVFLLFLLLTFSVYWSIPRNRLTIQNLWLVLSSYVFYGWWDYRFCGLLFLSSVVDYTVGILLNRSENKSHRRLLLVISVVFNLGVLGVFKYANFFIGSTAEFLEWLGLNPNLPALSLILPAGISFYTFQTMSYTIDAYRRRVAVCHNPVAFLAYVSFFPQLVAGPIERASSLLPQMQSARSFSAKQGFVGLRQILWGLFKKVAIADAFAPIVNEIFSQSDTASGVWLLIGVVAFGIQIYCDFSGYSDIAIGTARLFGFRLMANFRYPYFATTVSDFWRRWHISLSTWFRDYVYYPLGGSHCSIPMQIRNVMIVFLVSGLWHGANWTFIFWGLIHALMFLPFFLMRSLSTKAHESKWSISALGTWAFTMIGVFFAWAFFRCTTIADAWQFVGGIFTFRTGVGFPNLTSSLAVCVVATVMLFSYEFFARKQEFPLRTVPKNRLLRLLFLFAPFYWTLISWSNARAEFIYFQF